MGLMLKIAACIQKQTFDEITRPRLAMPVGHE